MLKLLIKENSFNVDGIDVNNGGNTALHAAVLLINIIILSTVILNKRLSPLKIKAQGCFRFLFVSD